MISGTDLTHVISTKAQYSQVLEIPMISGSDINHVLSTKARCLQLVKSSHDLGSRPQLRNFDKGSVTLELAEVRAVPPVVILQAVLPAIKRRKEDYLSLSFVPHSLPCSLASIIASSSSSRICNRLRLSGPPSSLRKPILFLSIRD